MNPDLLSTARDREGLPTEPRDFLRALRSQLQRAAADWPLPEPADASRQVSAQEDLLARFTRAASAAGTRVHRTGITDWPEAVVSILRGCGVRTVIVETSPDGFLSSGRAGKLVEALAAAGLEPPLTADDDTLFAVNAAVTGVAAAIAETGTVVCASGPGLLRGSSLIPPVHVAIVAMAQLVPDLYDFLKAPTGQRELPAQVVLISGPSKTSDIEGVLVTGVHGPDQVHVVLVES